MTSTTRCVVLGAILLAGCAEPYTPKELTAEEQELQGELSGYTDELKAAWDSPGDYVQVAVIDRETTFPDEEQTYSRVLVLQREHLDLDDYGFSLPGQEMSEAEEDYVPGFFNDVMFWIDGDGNILFDDYEQPPGTEMVVEWCVANVPGAKVSLHFGGNPCLVLDLSQ